MKRILVFGVFDVLHEGHRHFLTQARGQGDYLVAVVARDSVVQELKKRKPVQDEKTRAQALLNSGLVDETLMGDQQMGTYAVVTSSKPQVICLGHDQNRLKADLTSWLKTHHPDIQVIVLEPFDRHKFSSSRLNAHRYV